MSLPVRPWLEWGYSLESELELELPLFPWQEGRGGVYGSDTAASGIPEAYVIRRDRIRWFRFRVYEHELPAFDEWLDWAQESGQPFNFRTDVDEASTEASVYLHSPRFEDAAEVQYERDPEFPQCWIIPVALRLEVDGSWGPTWTDLAVEA